MEIWWISVCLFQGQMSWAEVIKPLIRLFHWSTKLIISYWSLLDFLLLHWNEALLVSWDNRLCLSWAYFWCLACSSGLIWSEVSVNEARVHQCHGRTARLWKPGGGDRCLGLQLFQSRRKPHDTMAQTTRTAGFYSGFTGSYCLMSTGMRTNIKMSFSFCSQLLNFAEQLL